MGVLRVERFLSSIKAEIDPNIEHVTIFVTFARKVNKILQRNTLSMGEENLGPYPLGARML